VDFSFILLLALGAVIDLHLVWSPTARLLAENRFSQFSPIHELDEIQRQALNLTTLRHGNAEKGEDSGRSGRSSESRRRRSA
jgi:hypothetical protein